VLQPGSAQPTGLQVLGTFVWRIVTRLVQNRSYADVIISIKDGKVQFVRVHQTFLPDQVPRE